MTALRAITLNAGLLPGLGRWLAPVPHVEERAAALGRLLAAWEPDVLALQEVYLTRHRRAIAAELAASCPYAVHSSARRPLNSGLVVLTRGPVRAHFEPFHARPLDEALLVARGMQVCSLDVACRRLTLFNVHASAGGLFRHPENTRMERCRGHQIEQLAASARAAPGLRLIVGDLNTGPEASPHNLRRLLAAGWHDCAADLDGPTWDPTNPLNAAGPHRTSPPQRIDHVLAPVSEIAAGRIEVVRARRICLEPSVVVAGGRVTPSDHAGVLVEFELHS